MNTQPQAWVLAVMASLAGIASAGDQTRAFADPEGDAVIRRTDQGNDGPVPDTVPDLIRVEVSGWEASDPASDPYTGSTIVGDDAHLVRIDLVFSGLVNPPGTIGIGGLPFDPFRWGPTPVMGFVEFDIDRDKDTGGQLGGGATLRFLANIGRFGARPEGSIGQRAATSADDFDTSFFSEPQFERSGEDFAIVLCGCHPVTLVSEGGDGDGLFEPGEVWIVRSRYFQRAAGYRDASVVFGGSSPGLYDPEVDLRFATQGGPSGLTTTVSLVFPLDQTGAALLEGQPEQPIDSIIGFGSHFSVAEAIQDLIDAADGLHGPLASDVETLVERWEGEDVEDVLDPTDWEATALIGTAYLTPQDSLYVWTDVGFDAEPGDLDGDSIAGGPLDQQALDAEIASRDGGPTDADGTIDGRVVIPDFGRNFSLFDVDGDGKITPDELAGFCPADLTGSGGAGVPDGVLDASDFFFYLTLFSDADSDADLTGPGTPGVPDGFIDANDFFYYLSLFAAGCP